MVRTAAIVCVAWVLPAAGLAQAKPASPPLVDSAHSSTHSSAHSSTHSSAHNSAHNSAKGSASSSAPPAVSGESRAVSGRVLRGARDAVKPMAGAWVVLHRVGTDHAAPLDSVRTDGAGRYAFHYRTSGDASAVYFASSSYGGIAYFSSPFRTKDVRGEDAELVVHDTTSAAVPIHVRARHLVLSPPGEGKRRTVFEIFELSNDSTVTRIAAGETGAVWQSLLLDGARDARAGQSDFSPGALRFEQGRARLTAPFAPGLKQLSFTYTVPAATEFSFPLDAPADVLEVLVEDALAHAEGGGIASKGPATVSGRTFARFLGQDAPAGAVVRITAPGEAGASGSQLRVFAIMAALGTLLLVGLARAMWRRQGGARAPDASATVAELRARLAALDEVFVNIEKPSAEQKADHWEQRAILAKRITDAVAREQGLA